MPSAAQRYRGKIKEDIRQSYVDTHKNYEAPKITWEHLKKGRYISEKAAGILWKYHKWKRDPVPDESFYLGKRSLWDTEKRLQIPEISVERKNKSKTEILLLCLRYNLNKLHSKIQNDPDRKSVVSGKKRIEKVNCQEAFLSTAAGRCGHFLGLVMQPYQGSAGTPTDSYFQVMF